MAPSLSFTIPETARFPSQLLKPISEVTLADLDQMTQVQLCQLADLCLRFLELAKQQYNDCFILDDHYEAAYQRRTARPKALLDRIEGLLGPVYREEVEREQQARERLTAHQSRAAA